MDSLDIVSHTWFKFSFLYACCSVVQFGSIPPGLLFFFCRESTVTFTTTGFTALFAAFDIGALNIHQKLADDDNLPALASLLLRFSPPAENLLFGFSSIVLPDGLGDRTI